MGESARGIPSPRIGGEPLPHDTVLDSHVVVLIDRDGWLAPFWTAAAAEASIELTDAEDGEYVAVDAAGRRVSVGVRHVAPSDRRRVPEVAVETTADRVDVDEVRRLLELALPAEQRLGQSAGSRSLIDCLSRLVHRREHDRVPVEATTRLRELLAPSPPSTSVGS